MSNTPRVERALIEAMAKHLPPSGAALRLLDWDGATGAVLRELRADLDIDTNNGHYDWQPDSLDAIAIYDRAYAPLLPDALAALRPGGRLIIVDSNDNPDARHVTLLEGAGYARILVEIAAECPLPIGVLMRGEKPHITDDTLERVRGTAQRDDLLTDLNRYPGRYLHLLIRQTPNKPVWALRPDEALHWEAIAAQHDDGVALLAFSSLSKAVAFMQPAVLAGQIRDVNKVGKFAVATAQAWEMPLLLNPANDVLANYAQVSIVVDPTSAEASDE
jgi:SAM-dependent methyltransferase